MGISPIPGILPLPATRVPRAESDVSRVADVENSPKPDDDTYSGNSRNAAGGEDDDSEEFETAVETEPGGETHEEVQGIKVNFFA